VFPLYRDCAEIFRNGLFRFCLKLEHVTVVVMTRGLARFFGVRGEKSLWPPLANYEFKKSELFIAFRFTWFVGRDIVVSIATCYGLDGPEFESRWGRVPQPS
jgi:hypothetical protein